MAVSAEVCVSQRTALAVRILSETVAAHKCMTRCGEMLAITCLFGVSGVGVWLQRVAVVGAGARF